MVDLRKEKFNIFHREARTIVQEGRSTYFKQEARCTLAGQQSVSLRFHFGTIHYKFCTQATEMPMAGGDVASPSEISSNKISPDDLFTARTKTDEEEDFFNIVLNTVGSGPNEHLLASTNSLLALPRCSSWLPFYPGQQPTVDGTCPVCDINLK